MKIDELESAIGNVKMVLDQAGRGAPGRDYGCNFHIALEVAKALAGHEYLRAAADLDMLYRRRIVLLHKGNKSVPQEIHEGIRRMQQKLGIKSQLTK